MVGQFTGSLPDGTAEGFQRIGSELDDVERVVAMGRNKWPRRGVGLYGLGKCRAYVPELLIWRFNVSNALCEITRVLIQKNREM